MVLSLTDLVERAQDEDDILAQLKMGEQLFKQDKLDEAEIYLKRARDLFPEYGGDDSPYWYLGQIYQKRGDSAKAAEALARFVDINENHYEAHVGLADIYLELGKSREAVEILERAVFIYPFEVADHQKLAELYRELGSSQAMIQERRALVGLTAVDEVQGAVRARGGLRRGGGSGQRAQRALAGARAGADVSGRGWRCS